MFQILRLALIALMLSTSSGCVKDKDYEDWRRQKLNEDLSELNTAAGTYRGELSSKKTGETMGAFEISLAPQVKVIPGSTGDRADGQATLSAQITFQDEVTRFVVTALDSYYDQNSGKLEITLPLQRSNGRTEQVILSGSVGTGSLGGEIQITGASELAGVFRLAKNSKESVSDIAGKIKGSKPVAPAGAWMGSTRFNSSNERPVTAVFIEPSLSPEEQFLNRFASLQVVQFTLNYSDSLKLVHEGALWDRRTGKMSGKARIDLGNSSTEILTECESTPQEWNCAHKTQGLGTVASTRVVLETDPASIGKLPSDPSDARSVRTVERFGTAGLPSGEVKTWIKATYAARTREQELRDLFIPIPERPVSISLQFELPGEPSERRLIVVFDQANFDGRSRTLDGRTQLRQGATVFEVSLRCSDFSFPELELSPSTGQQASICQYWSSHRAQPLTITFP